MSASCLPPMSSAALPNSQDASDTRWATLGYEYTNPWGSDVTVWHVVPVHAVQPHHAGLHASADTGTTRSLCWCEPLLELQPNGDWLVTHDPAPEAV